MTNDETFDEWVAKINFLSIYPFLMDNTKSNITKILENFNIEIPKEYIPYLQYSIDAFTPEIAKHSYLKLFTNNMCRKYNKTILDNLEIAKTFIKEPEKIDCVFDIAAGHDGYALLLNQCFNDVRVIMIDSCEILTMCSRYSDKIKSHKMYVNDWFEKFQGNSNILIYMSELLHNNNKYLKILNNPEIRKCNLIINELVNCPYKQMALSDKDNKLIPKELLKSNYNMNIHEYKTWNNYYFAVRSATT